MKLNRFKIKTRIFSGFGILLALSVALAGYGAWQLGTIGSQVSTYASISNKVVNVLTAAHNIEIMARAAVRYRFDGTPDGQVAAIKLFTDNAPIVDRLMTESEKSTISQERQAIYHGVQATLGTLDKNFADITTIGQHVADDRAAMVKMSADLAASANHLVDLAKASNEPGAWEAAQEVNLAVMGVRLGQMRFLVTLSPKDVDNVTAVNDAAVKLLAQFPQTVHTPALQAAAAPVATALAAYAKTFADVAPAMIANNQNFSNAVMTPVNEMQQNLDKARVSLQSDLATDEASMTEAVASTSSIQEVLGAVAVILGLVIAFFVGRSIAAPVSGMSAAMKKLAAGDMAVEIPGADGKDELAEMAQTVDVFKQSMITTARLSAEQKAEQERKELRQKAVDSYVRDFEKSVNGVLELVTTASSQLESTAHSMSSTAEETQRQSTAVAAASEQASTNVQTVASAAEELSSSISEISRQVAESTRITSQAVTETEHTNAQIQGLAEAAQRIGDVVKLINDIAGQTNLLALNATIEAARAGEAGKGFAVVASEVKSLAGQTAKATEEISAKIAEMQSATSQSVQAVQGIGQTIARINEIATTIASAVEEQGAATQEIARNVQQASAGTAEVSSNIVVVTKAANDTGTASTQVLGAAGELSKQSATLRNQVDGFLSQIRAA